MNFWKAVLSCFCILLLASCGVEKRIYRHGFYVPYARTHAKQQKPDTATAKHYAIAPVTKTSLTPTADKPGPTLAIPKSEPEIPVKTKTLFLAHHYKKCLPSKTFITSCSKLNPPQKKSSRGLDTDELLFIIGLSASLGGVGLILLGAAINPGNPAIGGGVMILGLIVCLVGLVFLGINNPSVFADLLIGLIDALA